eukprot:TRINITY_DN8228_c0_g1_i1.p1 TRINITY_DN8228_c0_g1~~TRINITY_DN8228_c0_g1_i1.p1  ORF type:complete len:1261 (-),score=269.24 TRINITY_DN8228_c0_g1_i1:334-4116(-)
MSKMRQPCPCGLQEVSHQKRSSSASYGCPVPGAPELRGNLSRSQSKARVLSARRQQKEVDLRSLCAAENGSGAATSRSSHARWSALPSPLPGDFLGSPPAPTRHSEGSRRQSLDRPREEGRREERRRSYHTEAAPVRATSQRRRSEAAPQAAPVEDASGKQMRRGKPAAAEPLHGAGRLPARRASCSSLRPRSPRRSCSAGPMPAPEEMMHYCGSNYVDLHRLAGDFDSEPPCSPAPQVYPTLLQQPKLGQPARHCDAASEEDYAERPKSRLAVCSRSPSREPSKQSCRVQKSQAAPWQQAVVKTYSAPEPRYHHEKLCAQLSSTSRRSFDGGTRRDVSGAGPCRGGARREEAKVVSSASSCSQSSSGFALEEADAWRRESDEQSSIVEVQSEPHQPETPRSSGGGRPASLWRTPERRYGEKPVADGDVSSDIWRTPERRRSQKAVVRTPSTGISRCESSELRPSPAPQRRWKASCLPPAPPFPLPSSSQKEEQLPDEACGQSEVLSVGSEVPPSDRSSLRSVQQQAASEAAASSKGSSSRYSRRSGSRLGAASERSSQRTEIIYQVSSRRSSQRTEDLEGRRRQSVVGASPPAPAADQRSDVSELMVETPPSRSSDARGHDVPLHGLPASLACSPDRPYVLLLPMVPAASTGACFGDHQAAAGLFVSPQQLRTASAHAGGLARRMQERAAGEAESFASSPPPLAELPSPSVASSPPPAEEEEDEEAGCATARMGALPRPPSCPGDVFAPTHAEPRPPPVEAHPIVEWPSPPTTSAPSSPVSPSCSPPPQELEVLPNEASWGNIAERAAASPPIEDRTAAPSRHLTSAAASAAPPRQEEGEEKEDFEPLLGEPQVGLAHVARASSPPPEPADLPTHIPRFAEARQPRRPTPEPLTLPLDVDRQPELPPAVPFLSLSSGPQFQGRSSHPADRTQEPFLAMTALFSGTPRKLKESSPTEQSSSECSTAASTAPCDAIHQPGVFGLDQVQACEDSVEMVFDLSFHATDHTKFQAELRQSLVNAGMSKASAGSVVIKLRPGSVIASICGGAEAVASLRKVDFRKIVVMGATAAALSKEWPAKQKQLVSVETMTGDDAELETTVGDSLPAAAAVGSRESAAAPPELPPELGESHALTEAQAKTAASGATVAAPDELCSDGGGQVCSTSAADDDRGFGQEPTSPTEGSPISPDAADKEQRRDPKKMIQALVAARRAAAKLAKARREAQELKQQQEAPKSPRTPKLQEALQQRRRVMFRASGGPSEP